MARTTAEVRGKEARIVSPLFCLYFVSNFTLCAMYFLTMTIMASFAIYAFACSESAAGFASSVFMVGGVLGRLVAGQLRGARSKVSVLVSMIVLAVVSCLYFVTPLNYGILIVVRVIHGLAFGIAGTFFQVLAMETMPPERLGEGVGFFTLSVTIATAIGPFMGYFVVSSVDYNLMFVMCTVSSFVGLGALLVALQLRKRLVAEQPVQPQKPAPAQPSGVGLLERLFDLSTMRYSVIALIMGACYAPLNAFLYNYADDIGMSQVTPILFLVYAAVLVVSRPVAGRILDKRGYKGVLTFSVCAMIVGLVITAFACHPVMFASVGIFMALGFGTMLSSLQAVVTRKTKRPDPTLAVSTMFLMADGGAAIGPFALGFAAAAWGYANMYLLSAAVCVGCLVYCLLFVVRGSRKQ